MKLHLVGLPHTQTTKEFSWCAFTSLITSFSTMMTRFGYEVVLYAAPENEAACAEHVVCSTAPPHANPVTPEFSQEEFAPMNRRVIDEMARRIAPHDVILLSSGYAQSAISSAFPDHIQVEPIAGYAGTIARHRVFPSYAWMHILYSKWNTANAQCTMGQLTDSVIPHFLDVDAFPVGDGAGGYLLFAGRLNEDKGINIAVDISRRTGLPLKIIGAGTPPDHGEYLGVVGPQARAELMGSATAVLSPSLYCEPFCLVAVEAQMCGTPAITTDFGAFPETVVDGVSGYRCSNIAEFCRAAQSASTLDRGLIRQRAIDTYGTDAIAPQYDRYFRTLHRSIFGEES
jgi:glycosyltransferase involved in cell wall biosynthesis